MQSFVISDASHTYKHKWIVASGAAASIAQGVPTKAGSAGAVAIMADGNGTTSERFTGIAASVSTDTASAAGSVWTYEPLPGIVYVGSPKVAGAANTQAKIDALMYKRVVFDVTAAVWTVDSAAGDASTNCVVVVGGQYQGDVLKFVVMDKGSYLGA